MEKDKKAIGKRIESIRLKVGETMEQFGKRFNTSKGTVNNWEKGRNLPNKGNLASIASLGGISVEELLYGNLESQVRSRMISHLQFNGKQVNEESLKRTVEYAKRNSIYPNTEDNLVALISIYDYWYNPNDPSKEWRKKYLVDRITDGVQVEPAFSNLFKLIENLGLTLGDSTIQQIYRYNIDNPDKNLQNAKELRDFLIEKRSKIMDISKDMDPLGLYASQRGELTDEITKLDSFLND